MRGVGTLSRAPWRGLALAVAVVLLAGCASPTTVTTARSGSPVPTSAGTATPNAASGAVVIAYINATAAFVHAEKAMDPNDPALQATMTGQELSTVKKNLIVDKAGDLVARGDITPSDPHVTSLDGQNAVVRDCAYSSLLLYDGKTGGPAPGTANGPQNIGISATFVFIGGTWKESLSDLRVGSCPIGY